MEPDRSYRWRLFALSLAMLLPSLGTSIANVALPTLAESFDAPFHDVQWVVIAYLIAVTALVVAAGRFGDMVGRRRLLLAGIAVFAVASAAGAFAGSLWMLVAARAVQGAGAAVMMALTVASVGDVVPKQATGRAMGLLGTVSAVGTALGPSLGGALVAWFGWPSVFAFMAAAGAATFLFGHRLFPRDPVARGAGLSLDVAGTLLLTLSLGAYALSTTVDAVPGVNAMLAAAAAIGLAIFVAVELRVRTPLIRLPMLRDRTLSTGLAALALVSAIVMATLVVGPFYLAEVLGLAPVDVGLVMSVGPGVAALAGIPAGRMVDHLGAYTVALAGLAGVVAGSLLMVALPGTFGLAGYVASLATITAGYALFQAAGNTAVMNGAAADRRGLVSALLALARNLGLVTGASLMGALFAAGLSGMPAIDLAPGGETGLRLTFAVAAAFAAVALGLAAWGLPGRGRLPGASGAETAPRGEAG